MEWSFFIIFAAIVSIAYCAFLIIGIFCWAAYPNYNISLPTSDLPSISIIIAARNEEDSIALLLESLALQNYPRHLLEVIVVNDASTDRTAEIVEGFQPTFPFPLVLLHSTSSSPTPKKEALSLGITKSSGTILLFTDADCTMPSTWVFTMAQSISYHPFLLAMGPINYTDGGLLEKMLSIEQAALLGSSLTSLFLHIPTMCNGANMAIRRSTFLEVNGFDSASVVASGDDELLFHKVFKSSPKSICFVKSKEAIVTTQPAATLTQLFHQRKRWAGKWEKYILKRTKLFAISIFFFHLAWIATCVLWAFSSYSFTLLVLLVGIKTTLEFVFIHFIMKFLGKRINLPAFVGLQMIYSFYVVFFGLVSRNNRYRWKDRTLK